MAVADFVTVLVDVGRGEHVASEDDRGERRVDDLGVAAFIDGGAASDTAYSPTLVLLTMVPLFFMTV